MGRDWRWHAYLAGEGEHAFRFTGLSQVEGGIRLGVDRKFVPGLEGSAAPDRLLYGLPRSSESDQRSGACRIGTTSVRPTVAWPMSRKATVDSSSYTCQAVAAPANDRAEHTLHAMLLTAGCAQWRETGRQTLRRDLEQRDRVGQAVQAVGAEGDEPHAGW